MCDAYTLQLVDQIVADKVQTGEMFTALDVSIEAQQRGSTERHRDMKSAVHEAFDRGDMGNGYTRRLIDIPGAPGQAWLYHRYVDDPDAYQPRARVTRASASAPAGSRRVDRRSRISIPVRSLRQAGIHPGDAVAVLWDATGQCLVIRKAPQKKTKAVLMVYKVEQDGKVRIAQRTLRRAGIAGQFFDIQGDRRRIAVRPFSTNNPAPGVN